MAAMEEKIVAARKKKPVSTKKPPVKSPVKPATKTGPVTDAEVQAAFGLGAGPVSSVERTRVSDYGKAYRKSGSRPGGAEEVSKIEKDAYDRALKTIVGQSGGVGGAGSGTSGPTGLDRYVQQLQTMLTGGSYTKPYDDLETKLSELYGQAQPRINTAMTNLETTLQGMANPYANFQAQTTQVTPQLSQLLASQGVSQTPLQELAAVTNAQNAGQSTAFGNLVGTLKSIQDASKQGMLQDVATQRGDLASALEQSRLGMGAQIAQQRMGQQESLMKMLLSALAQGGRPKSGRLF